MHVRYNIAVNMQFTVFVKLLGILVISLWCYIAYFCFIAYFFVTQHIFSMMDHDK